MWVNRSLFQLVLDDNKDQSGEIADLKCQLANFQGRATILNAQKAKDDITIDWMRHRVNALEKQNAILLNKTAGVIFEVPEIVPTRPGSIAGNPIDFSGISFEDVGDEEAKRLKLDTDSIQ